MNDRLQDFQEVWSVDFEFSQPPGERQTVLCVVGREFRSGRLVRRWLGGTDAAPIFPHDSGCLVVAYFATAEMESYLELGWPLPARLLDLYAEFRCLTNGRKLPAGRGLLGALAYFGLDSIAAAEKDSMRQLAIRGGPYTEDEQAALVDYCQTDVDSTTALFAAMLPRIDLPHALLRGRFMQAAARMQRRGVPIDVESLDELRSNWTAIKRQLIQAVDRDYEVYVPAGLPHVNPYSKQGQAVIVTAKRFGVDPQQLVVVARDIAKSYQEYDISRAIAAARRATGLTPLKLSQWENGGRDHSTWPRLDVVARELAAEYPELGLGRGYDAGLFDDSDHAARLWQLLRDPPDSPVDRYDDAILEEAAIALQGGDYDHGGHLSFNVKRFEAWLIQHDIPWPRTEAGALSLSDDTFRQMSKAYPQVAPLRELRHTLGELRLESLAVGHDGRNRFLLSPFGASSSRNTPSNAKSIFGPSCWLRGLIKPQEGRAVAYVDWSQQEFGIAAKLSGDVAMQEAYRSGDPYLTFAKQAGAVPADATKESHPQERGQFKICALGVQYGMGEKSLALAIGQPEYVGRDLLRKHRETYPRYWRWVEGAKNHAAIWGQLYTVFGWWVFTDDESNPRSLANFPTQGNGAEMLRLACCLATERGIEVCCPIHDALLVEAAADEIGDVVAATQQVMVEASRVILDGFGLRSDVKIVTWPDRYMDERGARMWNIVQEILNGLKVEAAAYDDGF